MLKVKRQEKLKVAPDFSSDQILQRIANNKTVELSRTVTELMRMEADWGEV